MTMRPHCPGWIKLPRNLLYTPVWESHSAWRVFCRLVLTAGYAERREIVSGRPLLLSRGQTASSQAEIGLSTGLSRKAVRCALELLERERAVACIPCHGGKATVFQI